MYIDHVPSRGSMYESGIGGQRIAVVGYSHWLGEGEVDSDSATLKTIRKVTAGEDGFDAIGFFVQVRNYFGYSDHTDFWKRVLFFNFLPACVGDAEHRYGSGTKEQIARGQERFLRILEQFKPHKALIFTARGWQECPPTVEERQTNRLLILGAGFPRFTLGTYELVDHTVAAFGLRHPQYADPELMRSAVQHILAMPLVRPSSII